MPNNRVKSEHGHTSGKGKGQTKSTSNPLCVSDVAETAIQNITAKTAKFPAYTARARCTPPIAVHSFQEPHQPQMVRHPTLLALMDEASKHSPSLPCKQKKKSKNQERQKREHTQKPQAQQNDNSAHAAPHQVNRNTQLPPQGQQQYFYPLPPQQVPQHSQIMVQQDPSTATALRQMAQLHQQHFETSQTQTKALENIASASSFTSTVGCIPIYDGKDKDACTEWLQRCKEASYYTGYNFRLALLQRSSQDVAKVIRSLDKELSHDKLFEEIMCAFSGIPSTAAAIDELSCICQQPGQKLNTQPVLLFTARPNRQKTL